MTTSDSQPTTIVGRPTLADEAARDMVIVGLWGCLDELREQVKALTAELEQVTVTSVSHAANIKAAHKALDDAGVPDARGAACDDPGCWSLLVHRIKFLTEKVSRLCALESAVKALFLYVPGALDEILDDSDGRFARDAVAEALGLVREVVKDD